MTDRPLDLGPVRMETAPCSECSSPLRFNAETDDFECETCNTSKASKKKARENSKAKKQIGPTEFFVDGSAGGLSYTLEALPKFYAAYSAGDATSVLLSLEHMIGEKILGSTTLT